LKNFNLIAITADHYFKADKFKIIPSDLLCHFKWTNWQTVSSFLYNILESKIILKKEERDFAADLYNLLDKKKLRDYQGLDSFGNRSAFLKYYPRVFFDAKTAKFRGDFIGFLDGLSFQKKICPTKKEIFLHRAKKIFSSLEQTGKLKGIDTVIFLRRAGANRNDQK